MIYKTIAFVIICHLLACNGGERDNKSILTDSANVHNGTKLKADTIISPASTNGMNMSVAQWQSFKRKYGIEEDNIHTMFDKKLYHPERITGDYNGDSKTEWMAMIPPQREDTTNGKFQECIGGCNSHIIFSDPAFAIITVENNLGGEIRKIEDLDGDGGDEILVYPEWWQSNWNSYKVYSYNRKENKWYYLIEPLSIFANDMENKVLIKKSNKKGYISALTSDSDDEGRVKTKYKDFKIVKPLL